MNAQEVLKTYFGYDEFREGQERVISAVLSGRDVLAVMPTGSGKSICYQVPALLLDGITVVISPLISLMQDQVKALNEAGIHAGYINSSLSEAQIRKVYRLTLDGVFRILYVAPERLENVEFLDFADRAKIAMVTVDEAHCISQWGQDFRPSYLKIVDLIERLPGRPVVSAFTATATPEVRTDISCVLKLREPELVMTGFDRENLYYSVEFQKKKDDFVCDYIAAHPKDSGIIYCATRKNVDDLHALLQRKGVPVTKYHAGMANEARRRNQEDFIYDRLPVIVATNAFGMGIDKSNVRYVIHYNMPQSMENYYQEAGRAGRDGELSRCILLFAVQDIIIDRFLLEKKDFSDVAPEDAEALRQRDLKRLRIMENYCRTTGCLRNYILDYFGEKPGEPCDNCGNCHREYREEDLTAEAKWVINCVAETRGRYGINIVLGTLVGANRARLKELGTVYYKSYGKLKDHSEGELRMLVSQMILDGYLIQTDEKYSVLRMGDISPLKREETRVLIRKYEEKEPEKKNRKRRASSTDDLTAAGFDLFEQLRNLRLAVAREEAVPPYIVFSDKTLVDLCIVLPRDKYAMLSVSGVGMAKCEKYGDRFLAEIGAFLETHPDAVTSLRAEEDSFGTGGSDGKGSSAGKTAAKGRKKKPPKGAFCLTAEEAAQFTYRDSCYISEIRNELNRISATENIKKAAFRDISGYLAEQGYVVEEADPEGVLRKMPTFAGKEKGIYTVQKASESTGQIYTYLLYPRNIQEEIVRHFIRAEASEEPETPEKPETREDVIRREAVESPENREETVPEESWDRWLHPESQMDPDDASDAPQDDDFWERWNG